jgi:hypothetical protein
MTQGDIIGIIGITIQGLIILGYFVWMAFAKFKNVKQLKILKNEEIITSYATVTNLVPSTGNSEKFG